MSPFQFDLWSSKYSVAIIPLCFQRLFVVIHKCGWIFDTFFLYDVWMSILLPSISLDLFTLIASRGIHIPFDRPLSQNFFPIHLLSLVLSLHFLFPHFCELGAMYQVSLPFTISLQPDFTEIICKMWTIHVCSLL